MRTKIQIQKTILMFLFTFAPIASFAGTEVINQLNFFYGQQNINPSNVNEALKTAGFDELKKLTYYGIQASRDITPKFNLGLRILVGTSRTEIDNTATSTAANYTAYIARSNFSVILTSPLIKTDKFKAEALAGFGTGGATLDIRDGTQDGKFNNSSSGPTALAAIAVSFGYKYVFLKIEGGYEYDSVSNLTKTGTLTSSVDKIDLSGGYFNVGILIDGLALGRL